MKSFAYCRRRMAGFSRRRATLARAACALLVLPVLSAGAQPSPATGPYHERQPMQVQDLGPVDGPGSQPAAAASEAPAYPAPEPGQQRFIVQLPKLAHEDGLRVELQVGRTLAVDCNRHWFGGELRQLVVSGWGYPYYVVPAFGPLASTRMACPGQEDASERFVAAELGPAAYLAYNSRVPLVVYAPQGAEVRYRIWRADAEIHAIPPH